MTAVFFVSLDDFSARQMKFMKLLQKDSFCCRYIFLSRKEVEKGKSLIFLQCPNPTHHSRKFFFQCHIWNFSSCVLKLDPKDTNFPIYINLHINKCLQNLKKFLFHRHHANLCHPFATLAQPAKTQHEQINLYQPLA